jgi:hypothetical protein
MLTSLIERLQSLRDWFSRPRFSSTDLRVRLSMEAMEDRTVPAAVRGEVWTAQPSESGQVMATVEGVEVRLIPLEGASRVAVTDSAGEFDFGDVPIGVYAVEWIPPVGTTIDAQAPAQLTVGETILNLSAELLSESASSSTQSEPQPSLETQSASVSGVVWFDTDGNGLADAEENRASGIAVVLAAVDGVHETITDASGAYHFTNLSPGTYGLSFSTPAGALATPTSVRVTLEMAEAVYSWVEAWVNVVALAPVVNDPSIAPPPRPVDVAARLAEQHGLKNNEMKLANGRMYSYFGGVFREADMFAKIVRLTHPDGKIELQGADAAPRPNPVRPVDNNAAFQRRLDEAFALVKGMPGGKKLLEDAEKAAGGPIRVTALVFGWYAQWDMDAREVQLDPKVNAIRPTEDLVASILFELHNAVQTKAFRDATKRAIDEGWTADRFVQEYERIEFDNALLHHALVNAAGVAAYFTGNKLKVELVDKFKLFEKVDFATYWKLVKDTEHAAGYYKFFNDYIKPLQKPPMMNPPMMTPPTPPTT